VAVPTYTCCVVLVHNRSRCTIAFPYTDIVDSIRNCVTAASASSSADSLGEAQTSTFVQTASSPSPLTSSSSSSSSSTSTSSALSVRQFYAIARYIAQVAHNHPTLSVTPTQSHSLVRLVVRRQCANKLGNSVVSRQSHPHFFPAPNAPHFTRNVM